MRTIFVKGHVAYPMKSVFNTPLATIEFEYPLGGSLIRRETRDAVHRFTGLSILAEMGYVPTNAEDLTHIRKLQVVVELFADPY